MTTHIAIAKKDISPLIPKGSRLIRKGKWYILEGYEKRERIETHFAGDTFHSPNFYPWDEVKAMKDYWNVVKLN